MQIEELLPEELLETFRQRAVGYDRDNAFFTEDLADLQEIGYLRMLVPQAFGGLGFSLTQASAAQRRLAQAAPATALGVNMHHVVIGVAYTLYLRGVRSLDWVFDEAVAGEIFGFGISEAGNDSVLFDADSRAVPDGTGGYRVSGTKIFTSMSPAWTRLVIHAKSDAAENPVVFGFIDRAADGIEVRNDWNTMGMRASQSCTTKLHDVALPADRVATHAPVGPNADPFVFGIFGCFELLLASVYTGIGERAVTVAADVVTKRRSKAKDTTYANDPDIRWQIAEAAIVMDGAVLQLEKLVADLDTMGSVDAVDYGAMWFLHFSGVKGRTTEAAKDAVELALRTSGGAQYFRGAEIERLYRDVVAGLYHPSDNESLHASYAKAVLGPIEE
ncbi:MAG TPA: acyl-CoA dehydrogenase family protein [Jiangellaceae bacterium]|nr:acyl-CoA dehydrogenase family protein [Jiangellaceae bacterium]